MPDDIAWLETRPAAGYPGAVASTRVEFVCVVPEGTSVLKLIVSGMGGVGYMEHHCIENVVEVTQ